MTPENYEEIQLPQPVEPPRFEAGEPEEEKNDMSDLFEVPQETDNDMTVDHLFELDDEDEDMSDLVTVDEEDLMGPAPKPKAKYRIVPRGRRVIQRKPPTSFGSINY